MTDAQYVQGVAGAQHKSQGYQAEASVADLPLVDEQVYAQPAQPQDSDSDPKVLAPPLAQCHEGLQSTVSSACETSSSAKAVSQSSEQTVRTWFCCPITKAWHALCRLRCLCLNCLQSLSRPHSRVASSTTLKLFCGPCCRESSSLSFTSKHVLV